MLKYRVCRDPKTHEEWIETDLRGKELLTTYLLNKGTAFTEEERTTLDLRGKLPQRIETLEEQVTRAYKQFKKYDSLIQKHIFLNDLHDKNEVLFYRLVFDNLVEMLPIVYTPVVAESVKQYNEEFRQPRGLYIAYPDRNNIRKILQNRTHPNVSVVVVTDGERVLGIGDQGVGAINISIAKLMLYSMCGGVNPYHALPIVLDLGTNNEQLLSDPLYLGWRHRRIDGQEYDDFIDEFVQIFKQEMAGTFLHWEDFGRNNARKILEKYRHQLTTFNDDMQGTSVVTLAALLSAMRKINSKLSEQRFVVFGAGTAGVGVADRIVDAMLHEGCSEVEARDRIWLIDRDGLLAKGSQTVFFQEPYLRESGAGLSLAEVVEQVKPTVLLGCSACPGAFTETIIRSMAAHTEQPIIFPLSNPTELVEALPEQLLAWTENKALIATGSPFPGVSQCNNAFSFPGIGLGVIAAKASQLSDNMLWVACQALSNASQLEDNNRLLPKLDNLREITKKIGIAVVDAAKEEGFFHADPNLSSEQLVQQVTWDPHYLPIRPRSKNFLGF